VEKSYCAAILQKVERTITDPTLQALKSFQEAAKYRKTRFIIPYSFFGRGCYDC
jgi:hypothetical protein